MLRRDRIDRALTTATSFLCERQAPDGAWRSPVYGHFKDGDALTPLIVHRLLATGADSETTAGAAYLASLACPGGAINEGTHGLSYPVYTAALTVMVLNHPLFRNEHQQACKAWTAYLRERQLTEALGWQPIDREYGGWGYSHALPRKMPSGQPGDLLTESNLSATAFALDALRAAGCPAGDPVFGQALTFVQRCQNYAVDPDRAFDDGGFFFTYGDPVRNKAGVAGTDRMGRARYFSYGSTTADGLRALLACGLSPADVRVTAARQWLEQHFSASVQPGRFASGRAVLKASFYYYYCWSIAQVLEMTPDRATALAEELLQRQQADGSWINDAVEAREDDPLVATPLAMGALAACRPA